MEAGVGIEPAYTDLQTYAARHSQHIPTLGNKYIKGLQQRQQRAVLPTAAGVVPNLSRVT